MGVFHNLDFSDKREYCAGDILVSLLTDFSHLLASRSMPN